jgi:branched-chain amino acid transport system permease protein
MEAFANGIVQSIVSALLMGMVFALVALGLTIIFGVMNIVNFAHGEFLMVGMYAGLLFASMTGMDTLASLPFAALIGFILGILCYYGLVKYLLRGPMIAQLFGTFGLMLLLRNLALLIFGSEPRIAHHGILVGRSFVVGSGIVVEATKLAAAVLSIALFVVVSWILNHTKVGKALTATALNAEAARYMGIPTEKMNALAWGIGGATVTICGALLVNFWPVDPNVGLLFTMIAFATVALGGFGNIKGAFYAGIIIGFIIYIPTLWDATTTLIGNQTLKGIQLYSFKYTFVYLAYFLIMVFRPHGLFGIKE